MSRTRIRYSKDYRYARQASWWERLKFRLRRWCDRYCGVK